jgi:HAMP domain-containing protein
MQFLRDPRKRAVLLLGLGVLLFFALLGALQAFNIRILNPVTAGETLVFTSLIVAVFILLMVLLMLLLRNILKLYADQSSSALGARLRTRMVLGATLIALTPAVFMFLFSFLLMNRSIDRWFSQPTTELRDDSTRVVMELAQYVTSNARGEAASIAATGAADRATPALQDVLAAHRVTLDGGFVVIYDRDRKLVANFWAPPPSTDASLVPWQDDGTSGAAVMHGPLASILLPAAQRSDVQVVRVAGQEFAVGMAATPAGKIVVTALPMPQGLGQTTARIRSGAAAYWQLFRARNGIRTIFFLMQLLITVFIFFSSLWLAMFLSKQITRPVEALGMAMDEIAAGKYDHRVAAIATGEMGDLVKAFNHMAADLEASRRLLRARPRNSPPPIRQSKSAAASLKPSSKPSPAALSRSMDREPCCNPIAPFPRSWVSAKMPASPEKKSKTCCRPNSLTMWPASSAVVIAWALRLLRLNSTRAAAPSIWPSPARASNSCAAKPETSSSPKTQPNSSARSASWPGKKSRNALPTKSRTLSPLSRSLPSALAAILSAASPTRPT